jgi:hypothetical protein
MRDKIAVELKESNKAGHIADKFGDRPVTQEVVFRHGRLISIGGSVDSNKLESLGKEMALLQAKCELISLANA